MGPIGPNKVAEDAVIRDSLGVQQHAIVREFEPCDGIAGCIPVQGKRTGYV